MSVRWPRLPHADLVEVWVRPDRFGFRTPRGDFTLPAVYTPDPGDVHDVVLRRLRLPPEPTPLFGPGNHAPGYAKLPLLEAFLIRALRRVVDERWLKLKPRVVFHGAESLAAVTSGYQYELLSAAARSAGARTVRFISPTGTPVPPEYARERGPLDPST